MIIRKDTQYLIVQRHDDPSHAWKFAQGGVEKGEDFVDAALREAQEELGTDEFKVVYSSDIINRYDWTEQGIDKYYRKTGELCRGQEQRYVVLDFVGEQEDLIGSDELDAFRWISEEEVRLHDNNSDHDFFWHYNGCISKILDTIQEKGL